MHFKVLLLLKQQAHPREVFYFLLGKEGNFLTATHSPSRELTFLPVVLPTSVDEPDFIERVQANPPELIVYVARSFPEWGYQNYAQFNPLVDKWVTQQHRLIHVFPREDNSIIRIYARNIR